MVNIKLGDLGKIEVGGILESVASGVLGFNSGLVTGLGALAVVGDENAVLGCANAGA